jgi:hypothetical protein
MEKYIIVRSNTLGFASLLLLPAPELSSRGTEAKPEI